MLVGKYRCSSGFYLYVLAGPIASFCRRLVSVPYGFFVGPHVHCVPMLGGGYSPEVPRKTHLENSLLYYSESPFGTTAPCHQPQLRCLKFVLFMYARWLHWSPDYDQMSWESHCANRDRTSRRFTVRPVIFHSSCPQLRQQYQRMPAHRQSPMCAKQTHSTNMCFVATRPPEW